MDLIPSETRIDFMKYRKFWVVVSLAFVAAAVFAVFVHGKLNLGVDFAGGTQITVKFKQEADLAGLRETFAGAAIEGAQLQRFGEPSDNAIIIKTPLVEGSEEGSRDQVVGALDRRFNQGRTGLDLNRAGAADVAAILLGGSREIRSEADVARQADAAAVADAILAARRDRGLFTDWSEVSSVPGLAPEAAARLQAAAYLGEYALLGVESVGPQIGEELRTRSILAVVLSMISMLIYIWIRFELEYGIGALMATFHNVIVCLGLFAFAGFEFNLTTIAAFLTLVGYSVNDTVVIFDRVRENRRKTRNKPLLAVMNTAINQTLSRTILTGGTVILALGALLFLGGEVLRGFCFVIVIGIVVGTYSTIYIASAFTLLWEQLFGGEARGRREGRASRAA
jgi:preprotein translocase subunit SecF